MNKYNEIYQSKKTELIGRGYKEALAEKCARKFARPAHPSHKAATVRRIEMADTAEAITNQFHQM